LAVAAEEEEAGEVLAVVLDGAAEDARAVDGGRDGRGDGGGVGEGLGHDVFDAAGGVVEGNAFDLLVRCEEVEALVEGDRVGEDALDLGEADAGGGDEVVDDADVGFGDDAVLEGEEVVVVFVDGAVEGVFDGDDGGIDFAGVERLKDLVEALAGEDVDIAAEEPHGGFVAEGAEFSLEGRANRMFGFLHVRLRLLAGDKVTDSVPYLFRIQNKMTIT
jgi:hypothetical protein